MSADLLPSAPFAALNLQRYPVKHAKDLQAWDAADAYLASFIRKDAALVLLNDSFGALHAMAIQCGVAAVFHINDSWCSRHAIEKNTQSELIDYAGQMTTCALVKLPKSLSMLEAQLLELANGVTTPVEVYFSGMQKHVSNGHLALIKQYCDDVEYLPTQRKARMYRANLRPNQQRIQPFRQSVPELGLTLQNVAGVFAEQKMDIGSRFFIEHFSQLPSAKTVADVGCGNGLLSLAYHQHHPDAALYLYDESKAAVESAQFSFAVNCPQAAVEILHCDGLVNVAQQFDLILINPPFHQQNTITTDIAISMFTQAKQCMRADSELWVVANRHLNYQADLKKQFRRVNVMAQNAKFVILKVMR
ncbi:class I SAM-dependent methyltransferase [Deefgea piscis]|uniref:class I SAM-dependent methyltransferase n=1 Tax=Deefgea piscis TaxID=2739061 RepID=UPI001C815A73|nr:methyltransferase [Deefgea piscis]QZA79819.1 methyltransferase [Deefgea piscis]